MNDASISHPKDGYVFIVTYGRSGSTLLQNLLNSIPGYQIRGENNNALFHLARAWHSVQVSEPMNGMRKTGIVSDQTHPWFGAENVDPDEFGQSLADTFVKTVLKPDHNVRVSGFKEIRFHKNPELFPMYLDYIHSFFPNSRFIFNTRDHSAVSKSGWWKNAKPENVSKTLAQAELLFQTYITANPDRCIRVHYDDYVENPETLASMFKFLGDTIEPEIIAHVFNRRLDHAHSKKA